MGFCQDDLRNLEVEMAWVYLFIAGALEVAWATGLKKLGFGFTWKLGVLTLVAMIASIVALYAAMTRLPLGIAYPIWTGIGSIGAVLVGVMTFNQNLSMSGIAGLILLITGMFLLGSDAH
jgi:quaternary ammonium compound-resistance protein SugE